MSFAALKKNSNSSFEKLTRELEKVASSNKVHPMMIVSGNQNWISPVMVMQLFVFFLNLQLMVMTPFHG